MSRSRDTWLIIDELINELRKNWSWFSSVSRTCEPDVSNYPVVLASKRTYSCRTVQCYDPFDRCDQCNVHRFEFPNELVGT